MSPSLTISPCISPSLHLSRSVLSQPTSYRPRLLLSGRPGSGQSAHLAPAVLHALEKFSVYTLDVAVLMGVSSTSPEEACAQVGSGAGLVPGPLEVIFVTSLLMWSVQSVGLGFSKLQTKDQEN